MKIPLKPRAKPMKKMPYRLNMRYKEKMKDEINKMLDARTIEPIEESK